MAKKSLPNYGELFFNEKGELMFHLCNGNNHKILLWTEGYKNHEALLKVIYDNIKTEGPGSLEIDFYYRNDRKPILVKISTQVNPITWGDRPFIYNYKEYITTPKTAIDCRVNITNMNPIPKKNWKP